MPRDHIGGAAAPERGPMTAVRLGHSGAWRAAVVPGLLLRWSSARFSPIRARDAAAEGDTVLSRFGLSAC